MVSYYTKLKLILYTYIRIYGTYVSLNIEIIGYMRPDYIINLIKRTYFDFYKNK